MFLHIWYILYYNSSIELFPVFGDLLLLLLFISITISSISLIFSMTSHACVFRIFIIYGASSLHFQFSHRYLEVNSAYNDMWRLLTRSIGLIHTLLCDTLLRHLYLFWSFVAVLNSQLLIAIVLYVESTYSYEDRYVKKT